MTALYRRILVPVHGRPPDFQTIELAAALSGPKDNAELTLIYVVEVPQQYALDTDLPDEIQRGEEILARAEHYAQTQLRNAWSRVTTTLLQARMAAAAVVDEAIDRGADAIILGTTNQWRLGMLTQGETVPYVLDNAPCDVVVLRSSTEAGGVR